MSDIIKTLKVAVDDKELKRLQQEFRAIERSYAKMSEMVAKEQLRMLTLQEKETEALQRHLGKMEQRAQKEADVQGRIFTARRRNIELAEKMSVAEMQLNGAMVSNQRASANVSHAMMNLNYVVRDSPYFFQNFALGVMAVGNNLNPLIDSMIRASKESKQLGTSLGKELLGFLKGPGGVIFAMSMLVTVFQAVTFAMSKGKKESDDFTESLENQKDKISSLREEWNRFEEERKRNEKFKDETSLLRLLDLRLSKGSIESQIIANRKLLQNEGLDSKEKFKLTTRIGELQLELEGVNSEIGLINYGWRKFNDETKDAKGSVEKLKKELEAIASISNRSSKPTRSKMGLPTYFTEVPAGDTDGLMKNALKQAQADTEDIEELYNDMWQSTTNVFVSNMIEGWGKIFGEANSMFEQLLLSWTAAFANAFLEKSATSLVSSLFDMFVPGLGTALGAMSGSPATQGGGNYYIVVDGDVIMPAVVRRLPQSIQRLQRLGKV